MTSHDWNAGQAHAYHKFQYRFPKKTLAGKTVILAGDTGGLGAATFALPAREGAHLVVGYRTDRELAEALRHAMESTYSYSVSLVAGDIASAEVREAYLAAAQRIPAPLAGIAIVPGDPARVPFENLNSETLLASLESNDVGPILLAKECGAARDGGAFSSSATIMSSAMPSPLMAPSHCVATTPSGADAAW